MTEIRPKSRSRTRIVAIPLGILAVLFLVAGEASAQRQGPGIRGGVSAGPDQFYFGLHYDTGPLVDHLSFRPNVEAGLGDDKTLVTFNFEFAYRIPLPKSEWSLYVGGGPAAVLTTIDRNGDNETSVDGGFNVLLGVAHYRGLFMELKVGAMESPSLKLGVGYSF